MKSIFNGVATALVTPFCEKGIDFDCLQRLLERQISADVDAILLLGTTGEYTTATARERQGATEFTAHFLKNAVVSEKQDAKPFKANAAVNGADFAAKKANVAVKKGRKIPLIVGCAENDTKNAVCAAKRAQENGADGLLVSTPYFCGCTKDGLYLHVKAVCQAVDLPVILYCARHRTGVTLGEETLEKLADLPNFYGIKDADGELARSLLFLRLARCAFSVYCGTDAHNLPLLCCGANGVISVLSNVVPSLVKAQYIAVQNGDLHAARALDAALSPLSRLLFIETNPVPVKAAMNLLGYFCGAPKLPLTPLDAEKTAQLARELSRLKERAIALGFKKEDVF